MRLEMNDSSDEFIDIFYRGKSVQPINYTSDEDELGPEGNLVDFSYNEFSCSHLDMNVESQGEEWRPIQKTEIQSTVTEHEHTQDAELLVGNIDCNDPFELYKLFATDSILQLMVEETNKYSIQCGFSANRRKHELSWEPITISQMKVFIAILLIMGIIQMSDIRLYWYEKKMCGNERIKNVMKRNSFLAILKCIHFCDNTTSETEDPLNKISKIVTEIISTFKNTLKPGKTVVIDESMIPWRGRLRFRQYIKGKRHKYGIKVYKLCLPSGYTI
ncbi:PiggyBac transposable element-derived protein 4 [Anthophora retusa]